MFNFVGDFKRTDEVPKGAQAIHKSKSYGFWKYEEGYYWFWGEVHRYWSHSRQKPQNFQEPQFLKIGE